MASGHYQDLGLWNQLQSFVQTLVAILDVDFGTDPSLSRTTGPDMILSSSWVWMAPSQVAVLATQICMARPYRGPQTPTWTQVADLTLGIHVALDGKRSHIYPPRPRLL